MCCCIVSTSSLGREALIVFLHDAAVRPAVDKHHDPNNGGAERETDTPRRVHAVNSAQIKGD